MRKRTHRSWVSTSSTLSVGTPVPCPHKGLAWSELSGCFWVDWIHEWLSVVSVLLHSPTKKSALSILWLCLTSPYSCPASLVGVYGMTERGKGAVLHSCHFVSKTGKRLNNNWSEFLLWFHLNGRLFLKEGKYRKNNIKCWKFLTNKDICYKLPERWLNATYQ